MHAQTITTIAMLTAASGAASAEINTTWGFSDLSASFDGASSLIIEDTLLSGTQGTSGDVTYLGGASPSVAEFNSGFQNLATDADVLITMTIGAFSTETADATGNFTITDENGDTLEGAFEGSWVRGFGFAFFNGNVTSASYNINDGDGEFIAPDGLTGFDNSTESLNGGISFLALLPAWFDSTSGFSDASTQGDAILLPTPASLVLAGAGFAFATRRKR